MIYFFNAGLQQYFALSSAKSSRLSQGCVRSQDLSCSQAVLFPAAICSTLGGHFTFPDASFLLPLFQTLQHGDDVRWFLSQFDRPCCVFVSTEDSRPFLPSLAHTRTLSAWKKNTFMSYCICKTESLPLANPAQIFTVDSQVLVQSSWRELTSVFPFDTRHEWKTRQTRFPHKGLEGSSSISEAACSAGFITFGTHKKNPFLTI